MGRVRRVVVKVGSGLLTTSSFRVDSTYLEELSEQVSALWRDGREVALVSSGAIAAGIRSLRLRERPERMADLQAAAAVGQSHLMRIYERMFRERGFPVGQVLLTRDIIDDPERYGNAKNTLEALFAYRVVPVINENDTVAVDEIRFGDNDNLSALVARIIDAELLVILSDVEGFLLEGRLCPEITEFTPRIMAAAGGASSGRTVGGMMTKLGAARMASGEGRLAVIASGRRENVLAEILAGENVGTLVRGGATGERC